MTQRAKLQNAALSVMQPPKPFQRTTVRQRSLLLQLPFELRSQILRLVVTQAEPIDLCSLEAPFSIDLRVMYVCNQLRDEARPLLYEENTLGVGIESTGQVAFLHFSRYHSLCEYRTQEAVADIVSVFLERFSRFQFRFSVNARNMASLHTAMKAIQYCFLDKHITVILPLQKRFRVARQTPTSATVPFYPRAHNLLSSFSIIRCSSFAITSVFADFDLSQHEKLIRLVTSNEPIIDTALERECA